MNKLILTNGRYEGRLNDGRLLCILPDVFDMNKDQFPEQELYDPQEWLTSVDGENCWIEVKRGPGRPRKVAIRQRIDITLSAETLEYLDSQSMSRSQFIEMCIHEHRYEDIFIDTQPIAQ